MSTTPAAPGNTGSVSNWQNAFVRRLPLRITVIVLCLVWSLPTLGLLITSFRPFRDASPDTYGAGRYLEPEQLAEGRVLLEYNLAYNTYSANNDEWSVGGPVLLPPVVSLMTRPLKDEVDSRQ